MAFPFPLVPAPMSLQAQPGEFAFTASTVISAPASAEGTADLALRQLREETHLPLKLGADGQVQLVILPGLKESLTDEGYRLDVSQSGVRIESSGEAGLYYGVQTLRQLMQGRRTAPGVKIEDRPEFAWRGAMLDSARHFMPVEFVKKFIDQLSQHKMNRFHWHLTEDQGWRIEIKRYPRLTEVGAWRKETIIGHAGRPRSEWVFDGEPHGGYYTQDQIRDIVAYAAERHVTVVPEIEMPGHAQAAIAAYPELGVTGQQLDVLTWWGVNSNVFNVEDSTIAFLQGVLEEVLELFPGEFIHIGGDECPKTQWEQSPRVQELIKARGLKDEHEMQSWFIRQMDAWLDARGRRLIGWDEILEGGLAPGAAVMSWRGEAGGIAAARMGHDVVMAPTSHTYLDYYQSADRLSEPLAIGGNLGLRAVYGYDPRPEELTPEQQKHVLGAQVQLWSEYMKTPNHVEYMAFPRLSAFSEVVWTGSKDWPGFVERLPGHLTRLRRQSVHYRHPLPAELAAPLAGWRSGEIGDEWVERTWDITRAIDGPGGWDVVFQYTAGAHRLDISGAWIDVNGQQASADEHVGRTGGENVANVYSFSLADLPAGAKVTLRARVKCDGGADSEGEILVRRRSGAELSHLGW